MAYSARNSHQPKAPARGGGNRIPATRPRPNNPRTRGRLSPASGASSAATRSRVGAAVRAAVGAAARIHPATRAAIAASAAAAALIEWYYGGYGAPEVEPIPGGLIGGGFYKNADCRDIPIVEVMYMGWPWFLGGCAVNNTATGNDYVHPGSWPPQSWFNSLPATGTVGFKRGGQHPTLGRFWPKETWRSDTRVGQPAPEVIPSVNPRPHIAPDPFNPAPPLIAPHPYPSNRPYPAPGSRPNSPVRIRPGQLPSPSPGNSPITWRPPRVRPVPRPSIVLEIGPGSIAARPNPQQRRPPRRQRERKINMGPVGTVVVRILFEFLENLGDVKDWWQILLEAFPQEMVPKTWQDKLRFLADGSNWQHFDARAFVEGFSEWYLQEVFYGRIVGGIAQQTGENLGASSDFGVENPNTRQWWDDPAGSLNEWIWSHI